jgi:D-alanyl-D-alanine endopeptidase (penicillin-binding protein 7)
MPDLSLIRRGALFCIALSGLLLVAFTAPASAQSTRPDAARAPSQRTEKPATASSRVPQTARSQATGAASRPPAASRQATASRQPAALRQPAAARKVGAPRKAPETRAAGARPVVAAAAAGAAGAVAVPTIGRAIGLHHVADPLALKSSVALLVDQQTGQIIYQKNADAVLPIASITKLMTAMVVLDSGAPLTEVLEVSEADRDTERFSRSRLPIGAQLSRADMLLLALMSSENRAAHALGRLHPEGLVAFVAAMNAKARSLGLQDTRFTEPTGLSGGNVSSARDLARLTAVAHAYPLIREYSVAQGRQVDVGRRQLAYRTTNRLIDHPNWEIGLQKTGYISEAGKCLVMQASVQGRDVIFVLLDAAGSQSRFADAERLRRWLGEPEASRSAEVLRGLPYSGTGAAPLSFPGASPPLTGYLPGVISGSMPGEPAAQAPAPSTAPLVAFAGERR